MAIHQLLLGRVKGAVEYTASNATDIDLGTVFGADWAADKKNIHHSKRITIGGK